ncbi:putative pentatricopeptide repeat-containing protein At1g26500 [Magnolia sinica]|uniref:putative pentatricopeptide repeat-containing protein At1g26500 n=1 Tax=Magnolia sinica TaxID=86752 RepID=UPI0026592E4E|nr:putative pentatricopeptide repeat-containing protein At1g26500 [Magnolia sinica]
MAGSLLGCPFSGQRTEGQYCYSDDILRHGGANWADSGGNLLCSVGVRLLGKILLNFSFYKWAHDIDYIWVLVSKLRDRIEPDEITYGFLIDGFCEIGDLVEACKVWNRMVEEGLEPDVASYEKIIEAFFKCDRISDAMQMFRSVKMERFHDVGISLYRLLITWLCRKGKVDETYMVFDEMLKRGISADNPTLAALVYGLLCKGRVREGYKIVEGIKEPDVGVYHGLIKGLLKLRKAKEATQVFREMPERGCEPTMHTYIMLLQGHLGKGGRKGPHPSVNFESIFVGGLVKVGKSLEATKYLERMMDGGGRVEVPRFNYNRFLHCFSNEEGVVMFEEVGKRLKEVGLVDLADILVRYGEKMATRERRRAAVHIYG